MIREILFRGFHKNENGTETIYIDDKLLKEKRINGKNTI